MKEKEENEKKYDISKSNFITDRSISASAIS